MTRYTFSDGKWFGADGKVVDMAAKIGKEKYLKLIARMAFSMVNGTEEMKSETSKESANYAKNKTRWTKATKAQLTDELIRVTAQVSNNEYYWRIANESLAERERVINKLTQELNTANEAYAAMQLRADKADLNLTDLFRTVKIVKATVNGIVVDGEDERDYTRTEFQKN